MTVIFPTLPAAWPYSPRQGSFDIIEISRSTDIPGLGKGWQIHGFVNFPSQFSHALPLEEAFGRGGIRRCGDLVIRPYRRGGLVRHLNQALYCSAKRFSRELAIHRALWLAGFPTVEPLGFAQRKCLWGIEGLYFSRYSPLTPWPRQWSKDPKFLQSLNCALGALNLWQLYTPDLNATNVMVSETGQACLLDWDKARFCSENPAKRHQNRLKRSLEKLDAPKEFQELAPILGIHSPIFQFDGGALVHETRREHCQHIRTLAHALRNPLAGIMLQADLTEDEEDPAVFRDTIDKIRMQCSHLKDMISDFTEMSLLDGEMISLKMEMDSPHTAIEDVILSCTYQLEQKSQKVKTLIQGSPVIQADFHHFRQVIRHILCFAYTYGNEGAEFELSVEGRGPEVLFSFVIPGFILNEADLKCLFSRFFHPSRRSSGRDNNLGISLFLAKALTEKMGGQATAETSAVDTRLFFVFASDAAKVQEVQCP